MSSFITFVIWLIILITLSRVLDKLLSELFPKGHYRWVIWPGIVVHEASHALVGKLMGARITDVSLFSKTGGSVTHTKPKVPLVGKPLTSLAPLFGCIITLILLSYAFGFHEHLIMSNVSFTGAFFNIIGLFQENFLNWRFWLFIYLMLAISTAIAPSNQDFKNCWWGIAMIVVGTGAFLYFDIGVTFLVNSLHVMNSLFILGVIFESIILFFLTPIWMYKRTR